MHAVTSGVSLKASHKSTTNLQTLSLLKMSQLTCREHSGIVVECRTPNREVLGSIPTSVTMLCP